ncbi:MAG: TrkH family potassium uptake protein, partial [Planctomycetota bacterium]
MNWLLLCRMLGLLAMAVGASMAVSLPWAFPGPGVVTEFEEEGFRALSLSMAISLGCGALLTYVGRSPSSATVFRKEAMAVVGLGWIVAGVFGALPFWLSGTTVGDRPITFVEAVFESVSGFTTTGASTLTELEYPAAIPRCVMFWRCFTHWLGGMGIVVLVVAVLGQLGAAGKAIMRREVPGPISESVRPRVRETALTLWSIYVGLSAILAAIFVLEGMSLYDALCHSFATMATGGFSTKNASLGGFGSPLIEFTTIVFMVFAGTNFTLFYLVFKGRRALGEGRLAKRLNPWLTDPEYRVYLGLLAGVTLLLSLGVWWRGLYPAAEAFRHAAFITVATVTTTGFGTEDFTLWGEPAKCLIFVLMFVGGCAGSTAGGVKIVRYLLFARVIGIEVEKAYRPNVVRQMKVGGVKVKAETGYEVVVYFGLILSIFVAGWLALAVIEPDAAWAADEEHAVAEKLIDCASASASCLNNIGPGFGVLGPHDNYAFFSQPGKVLLIVLMLLGRLELFA